MHQNYRHGSARGLGSRDIDSKPNDPNNCGPKPSTTKSIWRTDDIWEGDSKILIGIDIGPTDSGVAFAFLQKGMSQIVYRVGRWPGQAAQSQSRIPTLIWYDKKGKPVAFGANAASEEAREDAEEYGWTLAKHFKLHLHPSKIREQRSIQLDPLPYNVSLHQVYSDFLRYLLVHTELVFVHQVLDGRGIWDLHRSNILFVFSHPNGWGTQQQDFLQEAAIEGGLVDATTANTRIRFVTEAEAYARFCIRHSLSNSIQDGFNLAVCNAGASAIDTTVYTVDVTSSILKLTEKHDSASVRAGDAYVNKEVEKHLQNILSGAGVPGKDIQECVNTGVKDFELCAKRLFLDNSQQVRIKLSNPSIQVCKPEINIRRGTLTLPGTTVQTFFDVSIRKIIASVDEQIRGIDMSSILLVGRFSDNPYLQKQLREHYNSLGCHSTSSDAFTTEAIAEGAVLGGINVTYRPSLRCSFGFQNYTRFDAESSDHQGRTTFLAADGYEKVGGIWCEVVKKGTTLDEASVYRQCLFQTYSTPNPNLTCFEVVLYSYSGDDQPRWLRSTQGTLLEGFETEALITANLQSMCGRLEGKIGPHGKRYWSLIFWLCIRFADDVLHAYLEWEDEGETRQGVLSVIPLDC